MALFSDYNIEQLLEDLFMEMQKFTYNRYDSDLPKFINACYDCDPLLLGKMVLLFRQLNDEKKNPEIRKTPTALLAYTKIIKLLNSKNPLDDNDAHPIGQDLSIYSCSGSSQEVLNFKRLKNTDNAKKMVETPLLGYIKNKLGFKSEQIMPNIKDHVLFGKKEEYYWYRVILTPNEKDKDDYINPLKELLKTPIIATGLKDIAILSNEYGILEFYYNQKKTKMVDILCAFNANDQISKIVFCSNLIKMRVMNVFSNADLMSNMLKFYYCYKTKNLTFCVLSQRQMEILSKTYIYCAMLLFTPTLLKPDGILSAGPLSIVSYNKPMISLQQKIKIVEPMTPYESVYLKEEGLENINKTAVSPESYQLNARHILYSISQDRDLRCLYGYSKTGGITQGELVLTQSKEQQNKRIKYLQKLSKK
ncbi:P47 [Macrobrachium rosenbergii nudivirus]|nr:P47 [Macrobrachium rosenbergii nudivirus]